MPAKEAIQGGAWGLWFWLQPIDQAPQALLRVGSLSVGPSLCRSAFVAQVRCVPAAWLLLLIRWRYCRIKYSSGVWRGRCVAMETAPRRCTSTLRAAVSFLISLHSLVVCIVQAPLIYPCHTAHMSEEQYHPSVVWLISGSASLCLDSKAANFSF